MTDDKLQILQNPVVLEGTNLGSVFTGDVWAFSHHDTQDPRIGTNYYRPMQLLAYAAEYRLFADHPLGWHLVNVLLNTTVVVVAYLCVVLLANPTLAFWSALLFAVHPIHTEPVAWVAALPELQCALFLLLAMLLYHRSREELSLLAGLPSAVFFLAALFSKETALLFPLLVLSYEFLYRRADIGLVSLAKRLAPILFILAVYLFARVSALGGFAPRHNPDRPLLTLGQLFLAVPPVFARYIGKLLLPIHLNYFHAFALTTTVTSWFLAGLLSAALILFAVFQFQKDQPVLSFALSWFALTLVPALAINSVGPNFFAERYLYIPSFGFCIVLAAAGVSLSSKVSSSAFRTVLSLAVGILFVFCIAQIQRRIPVFHDNFTLLSATAFHSPNSYIVQGQLASAYYERGEVDQALDHVLRALQLNPGYELGHINAAWYYSDKGNYDAAVAQLKVATQQYPGYDVPLINLAKVYTLQHNWQLAADTYRRAAAVEPSQAGYFLTLASLAEANAKSQAAFAAAQSATDKNPRDFSAWIQLGDVSMQAGQWPQAAQAFERASGLGPSDATVLDKWGVALLRMGDAPRAVEILRRALQAQPDSLSIRQGLASSLAASNRLTDSSAELHRILQLNPNWEHADQVHLALGGNAERSGDFATAKLEYQRALALNPKLDYARQRLANLTSPALVHPAR